MRPQTSVRILIALSVLTIAVAGAGLWVKACRPDAGTQEIKSYSDAMNFQGGATIYNMRDDGTWKQGMSFSDYEEAGYVFLVESEDRFTQYHYFLGQRVKVLEVLRGDQSLTGKSIEVLDYGFADNYRGLRHYSQTNVLEPGQRYLLFSIPLNEYNAFTDVPHYRLYLLGPGAFNVDQERAELIDKGEADTNYQEVKHMDYFIGIPEMLPFISDLREQVLGYYLDD